MKDFFELIKELKKTSKGKAILFFGFYLVFFLVIAVLARVFPGSTSLEVNTLDKEEVFNISSVNGYNYAYKYSINIDQNTIDFIGNKNGDSEEFTVNNIKYYKNGTLYYVNGEETLIPNSYLEIIDNIDLLLENASYDSTTTYGSGKEVLVYKISSATISKMFDNLDLDIEEIPNEIKLTKNDTYIDNVELVLDSYCVAINKCIKNTNILISYSDFNKIGEITDNK